MLCEGPNKILFCRHCNTKGSEKEGIEGFSSETRANGRMHRLTESTVLKFHRHIQKGKKNFLIWLKGLLSKRVEAEKKSAWTDLDKVSFKNFVKESNVKI
jgi:hypothetical protein